MSIAWDWPGSRWWKCDLHLHSPGSHDFKNRDSVEASHWIDAARGGELDVVAVTDHNTGAFVRHIQQEARSIGRDLIVFPGVELTVANGTHLLVLFDPEKDSDAITTFLGRCDVPHGEHGTPEALSPCSLQEVIKWTTEHDALCIAAHVTEEKGLLKSVEPGQTLQQVVKSENLHAAEVNNHAPDLLEYLDNSKDGYQRNHGPLPLLSFSDGHALDQIGRRSTWIKMSRPDMKGLKLACDDGPMSVLSSEEVSDPNTHANLVIESVEVKSAKYMGRPEPLQVSFNPWLNTIVGGRGTGKSSLIEFLRVALSREDELPERLRDEFNEFKQVPNNRDDKGRLTEETEVFVTYRKDDIRYRVQWNKQGTLDPIQAEQADGEWTVQEGDIKRRFPLRIYSQKQIFELASGPESLLQVVDESPDIDLVGWEERWREAENHFLALKASAREAEAGLAEESRLRGELEDVKRKLAVFENSGHSQTLQDFQRRRRQEREIKAWTEEADAVRERLRDIAGSIALRDLDSSLFDSDTEPDLAVFDAARKLVGELNQLRRQIEEAADNTDSAIKSFRSGVNASEWRRTVDKAQSEYKELTEKLHEEEAGDPSEYGTLVQQRQDLEQRLRGLEERREAVEKTRGEAEEALKKLCKLRRELTAKRVEFLAEVLQGNSHVQIEVIPYGAENSVESEFRALISKERPTFQNDVWSEDRQEGLLAELFKGYPSKVTEWEFEERLRELKNKVRAISEGRKDVPNVRDQRFAKHLDGLPPEALDRLDTWFPGDSVKVSYSPRTDGSDFRPISQGSVVTLSRADDSFRGQKLLPGPTVVS